MCRSWDRQDTVAHEHQAGESSSPGRGRRERDLRMELRGTKVLEAIMASVVVVAVAVFIAGMMMGVIAVVAVAVRREDRSYTLAVEEPHRMSKTTRRLTGAARRALRPEFLRATEQL